MIDWNENDRPKTLDPLIDKLNRAFRSLKDIVILEDKLIKVGAVGTKIAHGQAPRRPRAGVAYLAPKTTSTNPPVVTEFDENTVTVVVGGDDVRANVLLVF
jgi:hypothetical protein